MNFPSTPFGNITFMLGLLLLSACSPKYDWREIRSDNAPYVIALPTKPTTHTRDIDLKDIKVSMTMVASEVDGVTFAVGSAELPDATQAQVSLAAMKTAMINNIGGTVKQEKVLTMPQSINAPGTIALTEIEALGATANGQNRILFARFLAKEKRVYQLIVVGSEKSISRDVVTTFFSSFKLN
ncbi:MAG: hypothetical protein Q7T66_00405 [Herminiimonas sp.]|uniref:hypothetical protein n=1 Tax=Herminiimonas sp. TaxID=1926289 RepID=UPI00271DD61E|nr:hypothetical protein [Herminiimonas sp.]MDO9419097.1 hypothetical protein [Herminiimonas sp.]